MPRLARVTSISYGGVPGGQDHNKRAIETVSDLIDEAAHEKPDIVALPEVFNYLGSGLKYTEKAERASGPTVSAMRQKARQHKTYMVCPIFERIGPRVYNSAILIDRKGEIVGRYHKMFPTIGEIEQGVTPGSKAPVFETDFGKVGFAICFDLNFRPVGDELGRRGVELILFCSMYRGGPQCSIWAHDYSCYFVSSTPGEMSVFVDPLGREFARSWNYCRVVTRTLNLDYAVCHIDYNHTLIPRVKGKYGSAFEFQFEAPQADILILGDHPRKTVADVVKEFKFETRRAYLERAAAVRDRALRKAKRRPRR